jgi:hypothetical protein
MNWLDSWASVSALKTLAGSIVVLSLATSFLGCGSVTLTDRELAAGSEATAVEGRQRKVFTNWTPVNPPPGSCQARNGRLILYSDGSQEWEIELLSPNGAARWGQTFSFYDSGKPDHTWFGSRWGGNFDIIYTNVWTYWRHRRGPADARLAAAFDKISYVVWSAAC